MRTTAAVLREIGQPLTIEEVELLAPGPREVRVRLAGSGVCHSDLHVVNGTIPHQLPMICGHEGAGVVEELGPTVSGLAVGDHVVLAWVPSCGRCSYCLSGRANLCETTIGPSYRGHLWDDTSRFRGADGEPIGHHVMVSSFARDVVVPDGGAIPVPKDIPLTNLALIGCAVATGVNAAVRAGRVELGDSVAVIGTGGVGLNAIQGARLRGAGMIIAIDTSPFKLELAERFGASEVIRAGEGDVVAELMRLVPGGVDVAIEAVGRPETVGVALRSVRRGGTCVVVGLAAPGTTVPVDLYHLLEDRRMVGAYYGSSNPRVDIPRLAALYRNGSLLIDELISRQIEQHEVNEALASFDSGEVARTLIRYA